MYSIENQDDSIERNQGWTTAALASQLQVKYSPFQGKVSRRAPAAPHPLSWPYSPNYRRIPWFSQALNPSCLGPK
jgi:hypothetical protein